MITAVGPNIVLRFADASGTRSDCVAIFDASGRQIDELHVPQMGGTVSWGMGHSPGVYFIRETRGNPVIQKVVLIR